MVPAHAARDATMTRFALPALMVGLATRLPLLARLLPFLRLLPVAGSLLPLLAGCATLVDGNTQSITLETEPHGAVCELTRAGQVLGRVATPGSLVVRRAAGDIVATCRRPGSQVVQLTLASTFTGTTVGNLVSWGPLGLLADGVSGADYRYRDSLLFSMPPAEPGLPAVATFDNRDIRPPLLDDHPGPAAGR